MPNGYGRGFGGRGLGFGFRGNSPPWPYVSLGRGGLRRCGYFFSSRAAGMPVKSGYPYSRSWTMPYYGEMIYPGDTPYCYAAAPMGPAPYTPQMTREQELDFLRGQAEEIKGQLEHIDVRIKELETE